MRRDLKISVRSAPAFHDTVEVDKLEVGSQKFLTHQTTEQNQELGRGARYTPVLTCAERLMPMAGSLASIPSIPNCLQVHLFFSLAPPNGL